MSPVETLKSILKYTLTPYSFSELPSEFQFGLKSISFSFDWSENNKKTIPTLLSFGSLLADTCGKIYSSRFELYSHPDLKAKFVEEECFQYIPEAGISLDLESVIDDICDPVGDIYYPLIGFNLHKNLTNLLALSKHYLGQDHPKTQKLMVLRKRRSSLIDISKLIFALNGVDVRNINYKLAQSKLGLSSFLISHPIAENHLALEAFHFGLKFGIESNKFITFTSLIKFIQKPCLITHMYFGKHEGESLPNIPKSYINYLLSCSWMFEEEHLDLVFSLQNLNLVQNKLEALS